MQLHHEVHEGAGRHCNEEQEWDGCQCVANHKGGHAVVAIQSLMMKHPHVLYKRRESANGHECQEPCSKDQSPSSCL